MDDSETLGIGEMDDINLPLDEIIQRKTHRERGVGPPFPARRGTTPRRYGAPARRPFPRFPRQDAPPAHLGVGMPQGEPQVAIPWTGYEEGMQFPVPPAPPVEFAGEQYWTQPPPVFHQPAPPPPSQRPEEFRTYVHRGGPTRGGIRKHTADRRRREPYHRRHPLEGMPHEGANPLEKPEPPKKEKCTMTFEKGNAVIKFNDVEILKVNAQGDLVLTTDGHQDERFLRALNDVLGLINVEILAEANKPESWKVKDAYSLFRYFDGIAIKGKGEPTKSRAETIKKAFEQPNPKALEATLASNLAARRLGLAFDPMASSVAPGSSICITQDQQLTRTSNYSISFVEQNKEAENGQYTAPGFHSQGHGQSGFHPY